MTEIFHSLLSNQPWGMIILIVLVGSVASMISGIAKEIRKYVCHRHDVELKRELVDRGLPVEEIERIVAVRSVEAAEKPATVNNNYFAPGEPKSATA